MAKITNKQKLEAVKAWLNENNIAFVEDYQSSFGVTINVRLVHLKIAIFLSDDNKEKENAIYNSKLSKLKLFHVYKPFFIRESESKQFVLEKLQNCCFDRMLMLQRRFEKKSNKL